MVCAPLTAPEAVAVMVNSVASASVPIKDMGSTVSSTVGVMPTFVSAVLVLPSASVAVMAILRSLVLLLLVLKPTSDKAVWKVAIGKLSRVSGARVSLTSPATEVSRLVVTPAGKLPKKLLTSNSSPCWALVRVTSILARLALSASLIARSVSTTATGKPPKIPPGNTSGTCHLLCCHR